MHQFILSLQLIQQWYLCCHSNHRISQGVEIVWYHPNSQYLTVCLTPSFWLSVLSSAISNWMRERDRVRIVSVPLTCPQCKWTPCWQSTCVWQTDVCVLGSPRNGKLSVSTGFTCNKGLSSLYNTNNFNSLPVCKTVCDFWNFLWIWGHFRGLKQEQICLLLLS